MKKYLLSFLLLTGVAVFSQNVNDYKYIIVPEKFAFLKQNNQYNLNGLTKMIFEKQGYEVYYEHDVFPQELAENRCKALFADMVEANTAFWTKITIELKDCKNQTVFTSDQGTSREKNIPVAYVQAFRVVGKSIEKLKSNPKEVVKEPVKELIAEPSVAEIKKEDKTEIKTEVVVNSNHPVISSQLFAQPIPNGFQLVDSTPKVVLKLLKTSANNFYIGQKDIAQGVVFNKNNQWYFEYYQNGKLVSEKLEIKF